MPYNTKKDKLKGDNHWSVGDIGESWVKYKLAQQKIDTVVLDRTYDLFAWKRNHRIEVKTSTLLKHKHAGSKVRHYTWTFKHWQTKHDAFDYVVLVGLDYNLNVAVYYVIPHKYIHIHATKLSPKKNGGVTLMIRQSKMGDFHLEGHSYDKFECCRNINFNLFLQDNKSAFTRKKNALTQKLLDYPILHQMKVLKAVKDAFSDKTIKYPTKELKNRFNCSWDSINKAKDILGINKDERFKKGGD